ncbi:MAG: VanZ family protein [Oscillibacter sp.]|nr:VanZ family protein [Oscillibacter sp.]
MSVLYSIFVEDTLRYIIRMFPGFLLAILLFFCLRPWRLRRICEQGLSSSRLREGTLFLFWLFCGGMAILTLTPGWFNWLPLLQGLIPEHGHFFSLGSWNLHPGQAFSGGLWQNYMLLGNIVMFVPFGFFTALLWRGYTWKRALLAGVCITGFVECWQLCVGRAFDIDDIILNTLGVFCGYLLWVLLGQLAPGFVKRFHVWEI